MSSLSWSRAGYVVYPDSVAEVGGARYFMVGAPDGSKRLGVEGTNGSFKGERHGETLLCPRNARNAAVLRRVLPWLRPRPIGLQTSMGFGDRLGLATPGHVQAVEQHPSVAPIFAQQSVRENARTGRTPREVLDDAMWGVFEAGWRGPWGADADHVQSAEELDDFVAAGYTLYTIDPGTYVDDEAAAADSARLQEKLTCLPWDELETSLEDMECRLLGRTLHTGDLSLRLDRETLHRAAAKHGRAVLQTARMYRHLAAQMSGRGDHGRSGHTFELEVSVDETATATKPEEHWFIAHELRRLGVAWVGLAPRFIGRFEKGVDYIGSLRALARDIAQHASIAQAYGPYKLSIHSGSDKFRVYPIASDATGGMLHIKTAGTSYLEALRAVARVSPALFRRILALARRRYQEDRATYHVSAELEKVCRASSWRDDELPDLLDNFDARQVLHVTYGSVLDRLGACLRSTLEAHEELYAEVLVRHFERHLSALTEQEQQTGLCNGEAHSVLNPSAKKG